uniref:Uncharacterized protein n=1 Tax=Anopheles funestus TaxID=62324 RepID=A0A4Y0B1S1_ANOFN
MDPTKASPDLNLKEILASVTPEQRAEFLKSYQQLQMLPGLIEKMRTKALNDQLFYRNVFFFGAILIVLSVFAFFGYKLYLSLTEKERKREEKLKAKQEKGKKKK